MPLDWQTVVVTLNAIAAALVIVRRFVPARRRSDAARGPAPVACDHCETGAKAIAGVAASDGAAARTRTTPVVSVDDLRRSVRRH
jgi:hypothetical protein